MRNVCAHVKKKHGFISCFIILFRVTARREGERWGKPDAKTRIATGSGGHLISRTGIKHERKDIEFPFPESLCPHHGLTF
jgi:hypothetical protein